MFYQHILSCIVIIIIIIIIIKLFSPNLKTFAVIDQCV